MIVSVVVPCYNEEAVLPETIRRLKALLGALIDKEKIADTSHVLFVDDGSRDRTWELVRAAAAASTMIRGIKLSRNRGHQNAVLAGLLSARGDVMISVDADLQDDLNVIEEMIVACRQGNDIVYGVRKRRDTDTYYKRITAETYYWLLERFGVEVIFNHADYRLMSRRAIEALRQFSEVNLFLRGIIPQLGFPSSMIYYDRAMRFAGESKYPLSKMLSLAWQGITSFSTVPLRAITILGFLISFGAGAIAVWALYIRLFSDSAVPGWTSTVIPIYLLGGIQLLCTGVIGEYLAKMYMETKRRPHYLIEEQV
jgi:glycosyltransferase involved in cell wall biosynthesis